jgi:hypothetical protein
MNRARRGTRRALRHSAPVHRIEWKREVTFTVYNTKRLHLTFLQYRLHD